MPSFKPGPGEKWTLDDLLQEEGAQSFAISPDGKSVVWVKNTPDKEKDAIVSNLMLSSLVEKREIELTRGSENHREPHWSPDGNHIAFLSARPSLKKPAGKDNEPRMQLWLLSPWGGEPWPITELERHVEDFQWLDKDHILFTAAEDIGYYESSLKGKKDASVVVEDEAHTPSVRFFKIAIATKTITRLSRNLDTIGSFALSPDGSKAVAVHNRSLRYSYDQKIAPITMLHDFKTGQSKEILHGLRLYPEVIRWKQDARSFYFAARYCRHTQYLLATITLLYHYDLESGKLTEVPLEWPQGLAGSIHYELTQDGFIALLADGVHYKAARYRESQEATLWKREFLEGEHLPHIFAWHLLRFGNRLLYHFSKPDTPTQWYQAILNENKIEDAQVLTKLNPQYQKRCMAKTQIIRWEGAKQEIVEGILYYPHTYEEGKRYPLVVNIHGGPSAADMDMWQDSWKHPQNLLNARGAFVLKVNYHGSSNYGLDWLSSISNGNYYDLELEDIEKGVDSLIAMGLVDEKALALTGWSNGAILAIEMTTRTKRYKAASTGAGEVDWTSDWGNCAFGLVFDHFYLGASPLENPDLYRRKSPFYRLKDVTTPTLIFFGTEDRVVPTQQGWMHYRALQQSANTNVRFVLFPGAGHGLQKLTHQRRKAEEEMVWLEKYLFATPEEDKDFWKNDSPLAIALKMQSFPKVGKCYGLLMHQVLIPEVVLCKGIMIGRFEVTRAQYAAFDQKYFVGPGKENYPAQGISFAEAKAYCEWLTQVTGERYTLGDWKKVQPLYEGAKMGENTLDYWAGYSVNPDDAEKLLSKIHALSGEAPLLKEVGSFKPLSAEELIFDLGGNVAEWGLAEDGSPKILGASADTPMDSKAFAKAPANEYIGFRVVKQES